MESPVNIDTTHVLVEDPTHASVDGEVASIKNNNEVLVQASNRQKLTTDKSKNLPKDIEGPPRGVDDMASLSYLHEPSVLQNLATRYELNEIYTYIGNILIAINPFQKLGHLYDTHMMEKYRDAFIGELAPHVFAVGDAAYRASINELKNSSILVTGESGSGKTETTKMLMSYLVHISGQGRIIERRILESDLVLEAFGNAKTAWNHNSSRFGKFVEIQFDNSGRISGAVIRTYLLETSRVCQINKSERNYHCFYFLCAAPQEDIQRYELADARSFHYLNQSSCIEAEGINDAEAYLRTRRAMDLVGIDQEEQEAIFRVLAAILHLGNINFAKGTEFEGSFESSGEDMEVPKRLDGWRASLGAYASKVLPCCRGQANLACLYRQGNVCLPRNETYPNSSVIKDAKSRSHLEKAAALLECDCNKLEKALITREVTGDGNVTRTLDPASALVSRDTLAKTIYSRLFDWIVEKINISIGQDLNSKELIGLLDICGFESFKANSFEQLCINYMNEKLQQHFNQHVFKMEQEEYTREDLSWSYVEFDDNQDVADLIEKKGGLIALLDEACMFPRSTHKKFAKKLHTTFKNNKRFVKSKHSCTEFTIKHHAGDVTYQADKFLDMNNDYVVAEHQDLLNASFCPFVSRLFPSYHDKKSSKHSTVGSRFKLQLQFLMETLSSTEPFYIRCVKPNSLLKPVIFEKTYVMQQLRCGGVFEAIKINSVRYPIKAILIFNFWSCRSNNELF